MEARASGDGEDSISSSPELRLKLLLILGQQLQEADDSLDSRGELGHYAVKVITGECTKVVPTVYNPKPDLSALVS